MDSEAAKRFTIKANLFYSYALAEVENDIQRMTQKGVDQEVIKKWVHVQHTMADFYNAADDVIKELDHCLHLANISNRMLEKRLLQEREGFKKALNQLGNESKQQRLRDFIIDKYDIHYDTFVQDIRLNKTIAVSDRDVNSIHYAANEAGIKCSVNQVHTILNSDQMPAYDPVKEFMSKYTGKNPKGHIKKLCECVDTASGFRNDDFSPHFFERFFRKWYVNMIATACGSQAIDNPLLLCLLGERQGVGKTEFFRRLLPSAFEPYYNEFPISKDKDFFYQMSQFMLILDDELDGKTKQDVEAFKSLSSMKMVRVRLAFGRRLSNLRRRASFAGTGNNMEVLQDDTGNRRFIPIDVNNIDHKKYNAVDKDLLFVEAFRLYESGFDFRLNKEDILMLEKNSEDFKKVSPEAELISKYFDPGVGADTDQYLTNTEIFVYIKKVSELNFLSPRKLGIILNNQGFEKKTIRVPGNNYKTKRAYAVSGSSPIFSKVL